MTAMRRHDTRDKRIERLEAECERLRRELAKKEECMAFLPPESFLSYYALLVEAVYLTKQPEPEVKTHQLRRQGSQIPVRNYKAYRKLKQVDQALYGLKRSIYGFLNPKDDD